MKSILITGLILGWSGFAFAKSVICFDQNFIPTLVIINKDFHTPEYENRSDCEIDPQLPEGVAQKYWKRQSPGVWVSMSAGEIAAVDAFDLATSTANDQTQALLQILANDPVGLALKGFALVNLDGYNNLVAANNCHSQFEVNIGTTVAAATSLANLQNRWANITPCPSMNTLNKSQLLNQTENKIESGGAD